MKSYAVVDRYITSKNQQVLKVVGYYDLYDRAFDRADRLCRVLNHLHDVVIVPLVSLPSSEYTYLRGANVVV